MKLRTVSTLATLITLSILALGYLLHPGQAQTGKQVGRSRSTQSRSILPTLGTGAPRCDDPRVVDTILSIRKEITAEYLRPQMTLKSIRTLWRDDSISLKSECVGLLDNKRIGIDVHYSAQRTSDGNVYVTTAHPYAGFIDIPEQMSQIGREVK